MEWNPPDSRDHSTLDGGVSIAPRLLPRLEGWYASLKGGVHRLKEMHIVQTGKLKWAKCEMGKLQISNEERRNGETQTGQVCKGNRPSMRWNQTKHAMESDQACNGIRPSMQWNQTKHAMESDQACNERSIKQIKYGFFPKAN
ncbi:hypothetical protein TNCV_3006791 [Trichonephila clavipes]|nr:hypothetical protein TNCV_3006791 [Trichonephila clavipes]